MATPSTASNGGARTGRRGRRALFIDTDDWLLRCERRFDARVVFAEVVGAARLVACGLTNGEIAATLVVSEHTKMQVAHLLQKLDLRDCTQPS